MGNCERYLTFDLGAESGRAVLGTLMGEKLTLEEIHRFHNTPQWVLERFHWDTLRLFGEIEAGLAACVHKHGAALAGIGVDTWGVDFALLDRNDDLLGQPYHYRDHRTDGVMEKTFALVSREEVYRVTGIQFMQINTLYQLMAMKLNDSPLLDTAHTLLMTPDLLNFWLTGRKANELTIASTSQCFDPTAGTWARTLLEKLGIPTHFLGEVVPPGTILGPLHESISREIGASDIPVIASASHDTASAVAAVPAEGADGWAYISCGTWSLVGVETPEPVIDARTLAYNLTNEGGVSGTYRLLRNVMGLWLLQQCRRSWEREGGTYDYETLASLAADAPAFPALIDPDDALFLNPPDMPTAITQFCRRTGQTPPEGVASTVRAIVDGLALKYRWVIEKLEDVTSRRIETIHIIGGGCRNALLCQATADASGRRVLAGPVEATAAGNMIVQAMATGRLSSLANGRGVIRRSFPQQEYRPGNAEVWNAPYARFVEMLEESHGRHGGG